MSRCNISLNEFSIQDEISLFDDNHSWAMMYDIKSIFAPSCGILAETYDEVIACPVIELTISSSSFHVPRVTLMQERTSGSRQTSLWVDGTPPHPSVFSMLCLWRRLMENAIYYYYHPLVYDFHQHFRQFEGRNLRVCGYKSNDDNSE